LGRRIKDGEKIVKIFGEEIGVKCKVYSIEGFSGHADQRGLLKWIGAFKKKPKKVFLVHGEEASLRELSRLMEAELGIPNEIAQLGQSVELSATSYEKVATESSNVHRDSIIRTLNALKTNFSKTLEGMEHRLTEDDNVKLDELQYMLDKLQDNISELKKEIS
jgi:metallo-beta-lactamase family protein